MTTWKDKLSPEALERKRERDRQRAQDNKDKIRKIGIAVGIGSRYANIWDSIPNKAEWFRQQLDKYAEEHKNE